MARYLIEVPHEPERLACARVVDIFQKSGSHWVTHADWGCRDGDHRAWLIVEADSRDEARRIVPPAFRNGANVVGVNKFTVEEIDTILREHQQPSASAARGA